MNNKLDRKEMGRRIKQQRIAENLTQEKVSEIADMNTSYISAIEGGSKNASLDKILAVINASKGSFDYILGNDLVSNSEKVKIDGSLQEIRNIIKRLDDKALIEEYVDYCRAIGETIIEKKGKQN